MGREIPTIPCPQLVIVDFREILYFYSPHGVRDHYLYRGVVKLKTFLQAFTVHEIISCIFSNRYDMLDQESLVWLMVENRFPNGVMLFEEDADAVASFELLIDLITQEADQLIKTNLKPYGLEEKYQEYLFDRWIDHTTALLSHKHQ